MVNRKTHSEVNIKVRDCHVYGGTKLLGGTSSCRIFSVGVQKGNTAMEAVRGSEFSCSFFFFKTITKLELSNFSFAGVRIGRLVEEGHIAEGVSFTLCMSYLQITPDKQSSSGWF